MRDISTKLGDIRFSRNMINDIVARSMEAFSDRAELLNYRGGHKNVRIEDGEDGMEITAYIVVRFGESIKEVTEGILDSIYGEVEKVTGQRPAKVTVIVTGTAAKNTVKRHIEVSR